MAQPKKYHGDRPATPAERQAAYNERKRQEERDRLAAENLERRRRGEVKLTARRVAGEIIEAWLKDREGWKSEGETAEMMEDLAEIAKALHRATAYLP